MLVQQNEQVIGAVYMERDWSALQDRLLTAGIASLVVLVGGIRDHVRGVSPVAPHHFRTHR